jgi:hypothetical protein
MTDSPGVAPETHSVAKKLRALPPELRTAGIASAALVATFVLPWYQKNYSAVVANRLQAESSSLSAFGVFSFVEAAILILALGVVYLVWARANGRPFHLPGGDGTVIFAAGVWAVLLLVWRTFDRPGAEAPGVSYGIQWGIFFAFVAAGALAAAGARVRAVHRPEPPNPVADEGWDAPTRVARTDDAGRRPVDPAAVTDVLRERPSWQGDPPEAPGRGRPAEAPPEGPAEPPPESPRRGRRGRRSPGPGHDRLF